DESRWFRLGPVIAAAMGDDALAVARDDQRHLPLFGLVLVEDERDDLAAERVEPVLARSGHVEVELGVLAILGDGAPDQFIVGLRHAGEGVHHDLLIVRLTEPLSRSAPGIGGNSFAMRSSSSLRATGSPICSA